MLEQPFFDYLTQHGFSKSDATSLCDIGKIIELPTRHIIYHQGEHPDSLYGSIPVYAIPVISRMIDKRSPKSLSTSRNGLFHAKALCWMNRATVWLSH